MPGGLGVGAVAACALFAAISGSSPVTVIAIGSVMLLMLLREGYPDRYAVGVLTTPGRARHHHPAVHPDDRVRHHGVGYPQGVGVVDPATLFRAGILPGLLIAGALSAYTLYLHWPREGFTRTCRSATARARGCAVRLGDPAGPAEPVPARAHPRRHLRLAVVRQRFTGSASP
ncbi:MAG: TRAP transporter large permease subunit [Myxococcota bacterium]